MLGDAAPPERSSRGVSEEPNQLQVQVPGKGLVAGDFPRPLPGPGWRSAVTSVEGVMDDHSPPSKELDMGTADAEVGDLCMFEPIIGRYNVNSGAGSSVFC